jgi:hypothetical protein
MTQMLMSVGGVGTVSVTFHENVFPRRLCAGKDGYSGCQWYILLALTNANSVGSKSHSSRQLPIPVPVF